MTWRVQAWHIYLYGEPGFNQNDQNGQAPEQPGNGTGSPSGQNPNQSQGGNGSGEK